MRFRNRAIAGPVGWSFLTAAFPNTVLAHTSVQGLEGFGSGLLHPITTPAHVLLLLALGLYAGQHASAKLKVPLATFAGSAMIGLGLTFTIQSSSIFTVIVLGLALMTGTLVALGRQAPLFLIVLISSVAGLIIGLDSGVETGAMGKIISSLVGTWLALLFIVFDLAYYVHLTVKKRRWLAVGARVLGSWIIAIAFLVLAFSLRTSFGTPKSDHSPGSAVTDR